MHLKDMNTRVEKLDVICFSTSDSIAIIQSVHMHGSVAGSGHWRELWAHTLYCSLTATDWEF